MARRCVGSRNLVREEAIDRYRAAKYKPTMGCRASGKKCPYGNRVFFQGVKRSGSEVFYLLAPTSEVKNWWSYISTALYSFKNDCTFSSFINDFKIIKIVFPRYTLQKVEVMECLNEEK